MRNSNGTSSYRPQYVPAFQANADGVVQNNSAQTQAIVGLQNLIYERHSKPAKANESAHMQRRQKEIDNLLKETGKTQRVKVGGKTFPLPKVAGPQPVLTGLDEVKKLKERRELQMREFEGSFLGYSDAKFVYNEIDSALKRCGVEKEKISFKQKISLSKDEYKRKIFAPLYDSITYLNKEFEKDGTPLRIDWRLTKESSDLTRKGLYFIYPNAAIQLESGYRTWFGALDVVDH